MSKVYIVQEPLLEKSDVRPPKDFSSLSKYGEVIYLLHKFDRGTDNPARVMSKLRLGLKNFSEEDYLVNVGSDPVAPVLAGIVLGESGVKEFSFLKWERKLNQDGTLSRDGSYIPVKFILP